MALDGSAYLDALLKLGAVSWISLSIALAAMALALCGGVALLLLRVLKWRPLSLVLAALRSIVFGVPVLVLILFAYYVLPAIGLNLSPVAAGTLALALCSAFFMSEIFGGALAAIPQGQVEAGVALGLRPFCVWSRVLLPQILRLSLGPLVNEFTILLKATALLSVVTVTDMMRTAQQIYAVNYRPFETLLALATIYVAINVLASRLGGRLQAMTCNGMR
ncbi:amino acid ABC transporter permease [Ancylobacter lacus]|uniref:amino acid ABC transporter permease n=1 Tax=Ancylobacter lacus TaxID=2579970 RepID=UPI001BD134A2|nr:amino acid ABC transporter permease [Ancylobacter lacus]MBS7540329.1 amino acid ABC transporter permease [Ancylobacter lacus]